MTQTGQPGPSSLATEPVYLRRNQDDVLTELPPRLETEEWVSLIGKDGLACREAVYQGNFMAMRRAAFAPGDADDSAKLRRLLDLTHEATPDGRKVVVFSFFRSVLSVITEPQWNPAIEEQAIARAHRMGQVRRVDMHRLLAEDSVDQRILEILGTKRAAFDEYARRSDLKEITPDSVDISDLAATRDVAARAESESRIIELERRRLRLEEEASRN